MAKHFLLLWLGAVFLNAATAYSAEVEATITPVPTSISGSFRPFVVAVDGKKVLKTEESIDTLKLDQTPVLPRKQGKGAKAYPFFVRTESDTFELTSATAGREDETWGFVLPTLSIESANSSEVVLLIKGDISSVKVDGKALAFKSNRAVWPVPTSTKGFEKNRVVELAAGKEKPGRLYNLRLISKAVVAEVPRELTAVTERSVGLSLAEFRLSQLSVFQKSGGNSFSALASWTPAWFFNPSFSVGLNFAVSYLKAASTIKTFPVASYEVLLGYAPGSFGVEVGGGMQTWFGFGGTKPVASVHFSKFFEKRFLGIVDRIFVAYSHFLSTPEASHEARFGFGVRL